MLTLNDLLNQRFLNHFFPIPATNELKLGNPATGFQLPDITHKCQVKLSDYRHQKTVVLAFTRIFSPKQFCPICFPHIIALNENYAEFQQLGAEILMITSTDQRQSQIIIKNLGLKMPVLSDPDGRVFRAYKLGQALGAPFPAQFVLDRNLKIRFKHLFSFFSFNADVDTLQKTVAMLAEKKSDRLIRV